MFWNCWGIGNGRQYGWFWKREWNKENNRFKKDHLLVMPVLLSLPDRTSDPTNIPTNPQNRGSTGTLVFSAPRHCAAFTPQPALSWLMSEQTGIRRQKPTGKSEWRDFILPFCSPNAQIGKYFFLQYSGAYIFNGYHSHLFPAALEVLSTEYKNSQSLLV